MASATPSVERGRIASLGLINSREHLEFEAKERVMSSLQDQLAQT